MNHNGVLWIRGHPGTGKSTLMKHIWRHFQHTDRTIATYFFNARSFSVLEKTALGMIRSLVCQLLVEEESTYQNFLCRFRRKKQLHNKWEWGEQELKDFLLSEMEIYQGKPLILLVDALDECSYEQVEKVVSFLEALSTTYVKSKANVNICLSSRHFPNISMRRFRELVVEKKAAHDADIATYVHDKLPEAGSRMARIEKMLLDKASGIFMWVVLVVALLKKAYDEGKVEAMEEKLHEVPGDLDQLFSAELSKDNPDKQETILMFQWVLFAVQPLSPRDLYYATQAGIDVANLGPWDESQLADDDLKRRITVLSRGLIEVGRKGDEVQFIHQSVKDYLLRNRRLQSLDPTLGANPVGLSHDRLKTCCISFIQEYTPINILMDAVSRDDLLLYPFLCTDLFQSLRHHPFLAYAARHWLDHAEAAEAGNVPQIEFLTGMKDDHGRGMERLLSAHAMVCYDEMCDIICEDDANLPNIFVAHKHKEIARLLVEHGADIIPQGWNYNSALYMSVRNDDAEMVRLFLNHGADPNSWHRGYTVFQKALKEAEWQDNIEVIRLLLDYGADVNAISQKIGGESALCLALQYPETSKAIDILKLILDRKVDVNARYGENGSNALHDAACYYDEDAVRYLLDYGADVRAVGGKYGTALQAAAYQGNVKVAKLLLDRGADIDAQGGEYGFALQAAALSGHREIGKFFRERDSYCPKDQERPREYKHTLRTIAVALHNSYEMVKLLLDRGANPNTQGGRYGTALQAAALSMNKETAKLLLEHGARINTPGGEFGTALQAAATAPFMWRVDDPQDMDIVRLLLEHSADVNTQGGKYGSALQAAVSEGREDIAILLLDHGAVINAQADKDPLALRDATLSTRRLRGIHVFDGRKILPDITQMFPDNSAHICKWKGKYGHALQMAVLREEIRLATLLLKHGADVNYRTEQVHPPLILAASKNNTEIATLLLEHGADVNGECGPFGNALQWTICLANTSMEMVALILKGKYGADVHRVCGPYGTALKTAIAFGRYDIEMLLRQHGAVI